MVNPKNKSKFVNIVLHIIGFSLCVLPPAICTLLYFPLWRKAGGEVALSGLCLFLVVISALPLYRGIKRLLRSPASYTVWLCLFVLFFSLSKIADEVTVISFVGFIGNLLGAVCFGIARRRTREEEMGN